MIRRLGVDEHPVNCAGLTGIKELMGGHKGKVFLLETANQKLVVKLQNEPPKEAVVGTEIMQQAGGSTPSLRVGTAGDRTSISEALGEIEGFEAEKSSFQAGLKAFPETVIMEFAEAQTIMSVMDETPLKLLAALRDKSFQKSLGVIMAADAFAGNPDRAMAIQQGRFGGGAELEGWYHEQNLMIAQERDKGPFKAVAIDNAFAPLLSVAVKPWGIYVQGAGFQAGSVAVANPKLFQEEASLVIRRIVDEITARHGKDPAVKERLKRFDRKIPSIAKGMGKGAEQALDKLLERGQHWKSQKLPQLAPTVTESEKKQFKERKRYLRLLRAGVDPVEARRIALDDDAYARFKG